MDDSKLVRDEYEKNPGFKQWMNAYVTYKSIKFDDALSDSMVIYSAKCWKEQREKKAKKSLAEKR